MRERQYVAFGPDRNARLIKAAREWAKAHGYRGSRAGWIYNARGAVVTQGWWNFTRIFKREILDWLCKRHIAHDTFDEWIEACTRSAPNTRNTYRPTLLVLKPTDWPYAVLADEFDKAMEKRNDPRRAYRGTRNERKDVCLTTRP